MAILPSDFTPEPVHAQTVQGRPDYRIKPREFFWYTQDVLSPQSLEVSTESSPTPLGQGIPVDRSSHQALYRHHEPCAPTEAGSSAFYWESSWRSAPPEPRPPLTGTGDIRWRFPVGGTWFALSALRIRSAIGGIEELIFPLNLVHRSSPWDQEPCALRAPWRAKVRCQSTMEYTLHCLPLRSAPPMNLSMPLSPPVITSPLVN